MRYLVILLTFAVPAFGADKIAGNFDYYVLSLSWSPTWCAIEGRERNSPQCDDDAEFGWILHGLWPQNEEGWPSYCRTSEGDPSRSETAEMADIMGTSGLAWHQWQKHGRCSGLSSVDYFTSSRRAYEAVVRPEIFRKLTRDVTLPALLVEKAFLMANPGWQPDMLTITCKAGRIQEARVCLTKGLEPRICGYDVVRDCKLDDALLEAID